MLADMGAAELAEWRAYEQVTGPLGGARGDIQAAIVAASVFAVNTPKGKTPRPPADYIPSWDRVRVRKTPEELFKSAMAAHTALGGQVNVRDN